MEQPAAGSTACLLSLMQSAGIPSYRALAEQAGVSRWQVQQLRVGKIAQMRVGILVRLSAALQISLESLLNRFGLADDPADKATSDKATDQDSQIVALQQEYERLRSHLTQQAEAVRQQVQADALQTLESWLVQWPTVAKRAEERTDLPAAKVVPLVRPVERLMAEWEVVAIAPVDAEIPYDPQQHLLVGGTAEPGDLVRVTHSGQRHRGKLLHRAKVRLTGN